MFGWGGVGGGGGVPSWGGRWFRTPALSCSLGPGALPAASPCRAATRARLEESEHRLVAPQPGRRQGGDERAALARLEVVRDEHGWRRDRRQRGGRGGQARQARPLRRLARRRVNLEEENARQLRREAQRPGVQPRAQHDHLPPAGHHES